MVYMCSWGKFFTKRYEGEKKKSVSEDPGSKLKLGVGSKSRVLHIAPCTQHY